MSLKPSRFISTNLNNLRIIILGISLGFLSACGPLAPESNSARGDLSVRLPLSTAPSDATSSSETSSVYGFQIVKLLQIFNLQKVRGQYARFYLNPSGENGKLIGTFPEAEFLKNKDGVYVPLNSMSLQMASIYYHMQNMAALDQKLGVGSVNNWPRDIGIGVRIRQKKESQDILQNNAIYEGAYDAILIVPTEGPDMPIPVNGGILAHEHFHSLFYKLVTQKLLAAGVITQQIRMTAHQDKDLRRSFRQMDKIQLDADIADGPKGMIYNMTLLKGLNEGLADFWGWMYTKDVNFIASSIPSALYDRSLSISKEEQAMLTLPTRQEMVAELKLYSEDRFGLEARVNEYSYVIGTQFAKALKSFTMKHQEISRVELAVAQENMAKTILKFLPQLTNEMLKTNKTEGLGPGDILVKMMNLFPEMKSDECGVLTLLLNRAKETEHSFKCKTVNGKVQIQ